MGKKNRLKQAHREIRAKQNSCQKLDHSVPRPPPKAKKGPYVPTGPNDLFDNPMSRAAMAALSEEDKAKYKTIGDHLYGRINFEDGQTLNNMAPPMAEAVAYLETQLQAGFHLSMMEDNEKALMADAYGDEWYERWGYVKEDLEDIVTLEPKLKNIEDK